MANTLEVMNAAGLALLASQPVFQATQAANQSIPTGFSGVTVIFSTPTLDTYGGWSAGSPTKYTPTVPGQYLVICQASWTTSSVGSRLMQPIKNAAIGGAGGGMAGAPCPTASYNTIFQTAGLMQFNGTTDYVELKMYQDSGGALSSIAVSTFMTILRCHT